MYRAVRGVIKEKKPGLSIGIAAAAGTLTNTIGVLGMLYILYAKRVAEALNFDIPPLVRIAGLAMPNLPLELVAAVLVAIPVVIAIKKARREP